MTSPIFRFDAPDGIYLYMYQDGNGVYVIEKRRQDSDKEVFIGSSAIREHARTMFRAEVVKLLEYWNCEIDA